MHAPLHLDVSCADLVIATIEITGSCAPGGPETRLTTPAGNSIVRVDLDGVGTSDMKIVLTGVTGLDASDYIL